MLLFMDLFFAADFTCLSFRLAPFKKSFLTGLARNLIFLPAVRFPTGGNDGV